MKVSELKEKLYNIFIKNNFPVVIVINGKWGIGKTYFWQKIMNRKKDLLVLEKQYLKKVGYE